MPAWSKAKFQRLKREFAAPPEKQILIPQEKARTEYENIASMTMGKLYRGDIYARAFYRRGRIDEEQGLKDRAKEQYGKFLDLWKDADPGIPQVGAEERKKRAMKCPRCHFVNPEETHYAGSAPLRMFDLGKAEGTTFITMESTAGGGDLRGVVHKVYSKSPQGDDRSPLKRVLTRLGLSH